MWPRRAGPQAKHKQKTKTKTRTKNKNNKPHEASSTQTASRSSTKELHMLHAATLLLELLECGSRLKASYVISLRPNTPEGLLELLECGSRLRVRAACSLRPHILAA
jgi:hypothetical protein